MAYVKKTYRDLEVVRGTTLVVPSVSIGNVPQLATDLLIHNLAFERIAHLKDTYLYPFASPVDYATGTSIDGATTGAGISTALEVFYSAKFNLTLLQQRSPIITTFTDKFIKEIITPFVNDNEFAGVLMLDSGDSGLRESIVQGTVETYTNEDLLSKSIESLKLNDSIKSLRDVEYVNSKYIKNLSGSLGTDWLNVLVIYVYEGENFMEANILAQKVVDKLEIKVEEWVKPVSWKGVYGDKPVPVAMEEGIYG
ncbi:hypothetical protein PSN45_005247 [Yamadazyma tenuis]|uniref:Proteasome assembly chaperone 2 n=1 Tax=Candida tenuis (strain ATCC 10573 / BCRC 21748 / CBS 615 / JCM 9827 / NBRC 10315 / NRRL Y-1498 / VKM Y-70) TaxID=590646 RepID=G3B170_CANTC|nr:uncharacterized protein CANTEDRAFT_113654 [Yamadazyma tenuis ATCC 10573]EGV64894.1 hypothetical protein CANTEDRAFT_113654 [Yamadazyma tenuis ATCC 10573]WEJ97689.1 hypothetical protein PSN45_005247 [Yamadazyma tenuis]